jgi:hypothetical protein
MADTDVGAPVVLHFEGGVDKNGKIKKYKAGRDAGDHLIEYAKGGDDPDAGDVVRGWFVDGRGSGDAGTFTIKK